MKFEWKSGLVAVSMTLILGIGVGIGQYLFRYQTPIQATSTDRTENRIMATGKLMGNIGSSGGMGGSSLSSMDAVYVLDQQTGRLTAGVLHRETNSFQGLYETNVTQTLAGILQESQSGITLPQSPKYIMVTGEVQTPRRGGSGWQVPDSVVYVHELNTGYVMVFLLPWAREDWASGHADSGALQLWACQQFFHAE